MKNLKIKDYQLSTLSNQEMQELVGGRNFFYDYLIGKALDWYIAGVIREASNPVHGDPMDWDVVGFK